MTDNIRDYGFVDSNPVGVPTAKEAPEELRKEGCPHCGCKEVMEITVDVEQELLKGGAGKGTYFGCPACPWASPMMMVARG